MALLLLTISPVFPDSAPSYISQLPYNWGLQGDLRTFYFQFYIKIGVGHATGASDPSNTFQSCRNWKEKGDPEGPPMAVILLPYGDDRRRVEAYLHLLAGG